MENKEFKQVLDWKAVKEDDNLFIEGYASVFGNKDSYNDIVIQGAFLRTLKEQKKRIKFCYQHDLDKVIGKIVEIKEDMTGLWFKAKISNTSLGKDVAILIEDEAIEEISIGYRTMKWELDEINDVRKLIDVELIEISLVSRAANEQAVVTGTQRKDEGQEDLSKLSDDELENLAKKVSDEEGRRFAQAFTDLN